MKRFLFTIIMLSSIIPCVFGKKEAKVHWGSSLNYEVETLTTATRGTKLIKVWGFGSTVEEAIVQAKKSAVSAAIFKGYLAGGSANATPPLLTDTHGEQIHATYFNDFFASEGKYLMFVSRTSDQVPSGLDRLKVKKGYKIGIIVQIQFENLRNQLIKDGIIRGLNSGF